MTEEEKDVTEESPVEETPDETPGEDDAPLAEADVAGETGDVEEPTADEETAAAEGGAEPDEGQVAAAVSEKKRKKKRLPRTQRRRRSKPEREKLAERKAIVRLPKPETSRGRRQERQGTVVSAAMEKTIVVEVDMLKAHRKYKKVVRRSTKFHAHDEGNTAKVGDVVRIVETRPLSKQKRWRLVEIVEVAK
jgi:small subunit ribosomal protein S17